MHYFKSKIFILNIFFLNSFFSLGFVNKDYFIPFDKNEHIHLKTRFLKQNQKSSKVIVLLPPLSIPSLMAFDVPGLSCMDVFALHGFKVWGLDFLGQGLSSFPQKVFLNGGKKVIFPLEAQEAKKQLNSALNFILQKEKVKSVTLLAWSWGSVVAGLYASEHAEKVDHLIFYGAMHAFPLPQFTDSFKNKKNEFNENLPAYQQIPWEAILSHWRLMMQGQDLISEKDIKKVADVYKDLDQGAPIPGNVRRPMGPMKDLFYIWNNKPVYSLSGVTSPTLVIYGDQDIFAEKNIFQKFIHVVYKKLVVIKHSTHWLIYEKHRNKFYREVLKFLK
jgi:pimeloyl-ACP methyl ester carboxylesterase